jgi:HEAT repeat protein
MLWRSFFQAVVLGLLLLAPVVKSFAAEAPDEFLQLVVKLIGDSDREFRAAGLDHVRSAAGGPEGTRLFASRLPLLEPAGQVALISALAERGDVAARPAIIVLLTSSADENVRAAAIRALGALGGPADLPWLISYLSNKSSAEQAAARATLSQMRGEEINQALAAELSSISPAIKPALIELLAARRASSALPVFLAASVDENVQVRTAAMAALGQLGDAKQLAAMLAGILKAEKGGERNTAEKSVALVCSRIENEDERGAKLIEALEAVEVDNRDELLSLVGRVGGKKLIDFVGQIATGSDANRRKLGIDALGKWPDASTADKLLEITNSATDPAERSQAFQGYVKIAATRDKRNDRQRLDRMKQAMQVAKSNEEQLLVINRCRTAYDVETLRFVLPYVDEATFDQAACDTIIELAHHREIRDPNKTEFDKALDKVIAVTKNPEVVERANRYKRGETWERQAKAAN